MSLGSSLAIAAGGLTNVTRQLAVVSQNVTNANTAGYTEEVGQQTAVEADGIGMGVRTGVTTRSVDTMMQDEAWQQDATVAGLNVRSQALAAIDAAHGTVGDGNDLSSLTGALSDAFTTLSSDPSSAAGQAGVVTAAGNLAQAINNVAGVIGTQRQNAQDQLAGELGQLNTALASIGRLSAGISTAADAGQGTASLEDQRDQAMSTVATLTGASFLRQANGDIQVILPSGTTLTTDGSANLAVAGATLSPQSTAPAITLAGQDITAQFTAGQIGANLSLRDTELPTFQAELDEFSHDLATRFSAAGLDLYTDNGAAVAAAAAAPPVQAGYVGLASRLQVNAVVAANPALVQQGTGGATLGLSDQTVIDAVLNQAFGPQSATTAPAPSVSGLGLAGTLAAPFAAPNTLAGFAANVVTTQTGASSAASSQLADAQATQTTLNNSVAAVSGVSVDAEMSKMIALQNAYAANARVITALQDMWTSLLGIGTTA